MNDCYTDQFESIDTTLTRITTPDQSGNNSNKGVLYTPQSSRTGASPSDAVQCHI